MWLFICVCLSVSIVYASLADGVTEEANDDLDGQDEFGGEYREFNAEDPNYQQEFAEDADGGKSNLFPLWCMLILFSNTIRRSRFKYCMYDYTYEVFSLLS